MNTQNLEDIKIDENYVIGFNAGLKVGRKRIAKNIDLLIWCKNMLLSAGTNEDDDIIKRLHQVIENLNKPL